MGKLNLRFCPPPPKLNQLSFISVVELPKLQRGASHHASLRAHVLNIVHKWNAKIVLPNDFIETASSIINMLLPIIVNIIGKKYSVEHVYMDRKCTIPE